MSADKVVRPGQYFPRVIGGIAVFAALAWVGSANSVPDWLRITASVAGIVFFVIVVVLVARLLWSLRKPQ